MNQRFPFRFTRSDVAVIVELYLPKRAQYQALLLQILSRWYEWERQRSTKNIKNHFTKKKELILQLLEHYSSLRNAYDTIVDGFPLGLAVGHSVYEVDGFFANADTPAVAEWVKGTFAAGGQPVAGPAGTAEPAGKGFAAEERTLVVRFIFRFPERTLVKQATEPFGDRKDDLEHLFREAIRGFLQTPAGHRPAHYVPRLLADATYREELKKLAGSQLPEVEAHIETLVKVTDFWIDSVALWLFGYLVLEITAGMNLLVEQGELAKNEDEIWITSFWDVALNRILPDGQSVG